MNEEQKEEVRQDIEATICSGLKTDLEDPKLLSRMIMAILQKWGFFDEDY